MTKSPKAQVMPAPPVDKENEFELKRTQIVDVLLESKTKSMQTKDNKDLLSEVIRKINRAKSFEAIEREIDKIRTQYQPRTLFTVKKRSSWDTIKKLDKLIKEERTYNPEKSRLNSSPSVTVEHDYLKPIEDLLAKDRDYLEKQIEDGRNNEISEKIINRYSLQLKAVKMALMVVALGQNTVPELDTTKKDMLLEQNESWRSLPGDLEGYKRVMQKTPFQRLDALSSYFMRRDIKMIMAKGSVFYSDVSAGKINQLLTQYGKYKAKEAALQPKVLQEDEEFKLILANRNRSRHHGGVKKIIVAGKKNPVAVKENIAQGTSAPVVGITPYNRDDSIQYAKGLLFGDKASVNPTHKEAPIGKATKDHYVGVQAGVLAHDSISSTEEVKSSEVEPEVNVLFTGDLMVSASGEPPKLDINFLLELEKADAIVLNLEAPVSFKEGKTARGLVGLGFEMSKSYLAEFVKNIKGANSKIKIVYNVANNHALDGNDKAKRPSNEKERELYDNDPKNYILARTIAAINEIDPKGVVIGAHAMKVKKGANATKDKQLVKNDPIGVLEIRGMRIGLLGFTDVMNWNSKFWDRRVYRSEDIPSDLNKVKKDMKLDYLCPYGHGSLEQSIYTTKHWRDLLVNLIKRGADLIMGHGPHVPQSNEILNGKLMVHSLGNLFGPKKLASTGLNVMAKIKFSKHKMNFEMMPVEATVDKKGEPWVKCLSYNDKTVYPSLMKRLEHLLPTKSYEDPTLKHERALTPELLRRR